MALRGLTIGQLTLHKELHFLTNISARATQGTLFPEDIDELSNQPNPTPAVFNYCPLGAILITRVSLQI